MNYFTNAARMCKRVIVLALFVILSVCLSVQHRILTTADFYP